MHLEMRSFNRVNKIASTHIFLTTFKLSLQYLDLINCVEYKDADHKRNQEPQKSIEKTRNIIHNLIIEINRLFLSYY